MKKLLPLMLVSLLSFSTVISANSDNKLTVYTYESFTQSWGPGPAIKKAFEAQCDCQLQFVALDDGISILNRLRLEGKNSKADIILGLDNNLISEAKKTGLLTTHKVDTTELNLPEKWSDNTFIPFDYGYFSFIYNKEKLKNPPTSLKELIEERDDLTVIYQDPRTSTPGLGLLLWIKSVYGKEAPMAWKQLSQKTITVTKGWSEAYSLFLKGESDLVLSYSTSPAYHIIAEQDNKYAAANFTEGLYTQVEVAAKVKSSKNQKLADQFMQFILTDQFQSTIATGNWMYPVTDIALPEDYKSLIKPSKVLSFDADEIAAQRRLWIKEWQNALIQ